MRNQPRKTESPNSGVCGPGGRHGGGVCLLCLSQVRGAAVTDRDAADLDVRQDEISDVLVGLEINDVFEILAWVAAGAVHQAVLTQVPAERAIGLATGASQFFGRLIDAINKISEEEPGEQEAGAPEGVTVN